MSSNMQMPKVFLTDVYRLILRLNVCELDDDTKNLCKAIETQIEAKIEAMDKRKAFTEYKTAVQGENREEKRKEYLEKAGIHKNWKTEKEIHF